MTRGSAGTRAERRDAVPWPAATRARRTPSLAWRQPLAFTADDRAAVQAFHDAAVKAGAEVLHAPRVWPEYPPTYFAAFVRDPDGNNVEVVCHTPE
ncbi:Glyoxalase-like domain-containing protein [Micromonospora coriariae]|uniref:Glyoxalase-like domain-containing protein n=1 Tax=Micromonospora coriariae TaxID=285665 RepID=A0A1C4V3G5_9ACTN|nr:Glyoxalase-like domain-containing protein [Micromonospora coriariae]